ncbi:hypothetical protein R9X47_09685 [Wukongibacter baidiensis]|uniref:hypothetical protein n=1 Tax=Wukongibacter baidiensis TaxID=1723361 RepID=UPI003D7F563E
MNSDSRAILQVLQKCIITTSISSLTFYEKTLSGSRFDALLIYNCLQEQNTETIPAAHKYEIIIDFKNDDIYNILVKILNRLLKFDCDLYVKILDIPMSDNSDVKLCMDLLKKLRSKNLIRLKIRGDKTHRKIKALLNSPLDNVTCFIGPGNTGKTSIIASVSELFCNENQNIALLDLTSGHKLKEYFPYSKNISDIAPCHNNTEDASSDLQNKQDNFPCLYTYETSAECNSSEIIFLCKAIKHLSKSYDSVLINTDDHAVSNLIGIFKLFTSIFIVHDCMINKIHSTHKMLLKLQGSGVVTEKSVSIIYNKVVKRASDMGNIEERLIFTRDSNGHLIPLIDINCMTLEISHSKKTAIALNNKITAKENALNKASISYVVNIQRLYNSINNIEDCDYSDLQVSEFVRNHIYDVIHNFLSLKIYQPLENSVRLNNLYRFVKVGFERLKNSIKELSNRYFKRKFVS